MYIAPSPPKRQIPEATLRRFVSSAAQASSLVKLIDGTANNAAWAACLDAYELLKPLKRFNRQVKGGGTAGDGYKRCFKALKNYQRTLIYASENRFFHVADMDDNTRNFYAKGMTDEDYYDFWASFGFKAYQTNKAFFTCLINKLRIIYERGGIKDAEAAAWSMSAYMSLSVATECHADVVKAVSNQWTICPAREWERIFKPFNLSHVEKLWGDAHRDVTRLAKEAFKGLFLGLFRSLWAIILLLINTAVFAYRKAAQGIKGHPMAAVIALLFILAVSNTVNYVRMKVKLTTAEWRYDQLRIHMDSVYEAYNIHNSYSRLVRYEAAN